MRTADVSDFNAGDAFSLSGPFSRDTDGDRRPDLPVFEGECDPWTFNKNLRRQDSEEFFVTYAGHPNRQHWVQIKCLYRDFEPGSLEENLLRLQCPRARSTRIYESISSVLPTVEFYGVVTCLTLKTTGDRLYVYVSNGAGSESAIRHTTSQLLECPSERRHTRTPPEIYEFGRRGLRHSRQHSSNDGFGDQSSHRTARGSLYTRFEEEKRSRQSFERSPVTIVKDESRGIDSIERVGQSDRIRILR